MRIAVVTELPTPYRQPVFQRLAEHAEHVVEFFFLARTQADRHWTVPALPKGKEKTFPGWQACFKGYHTVHWNWGWKKYLLKERFDVFVIGGYAQPLMWSLLRFCWARNRPYVMWTESHLGKSRSAIRRRSKAFYLERVYRRSGANLVMGSASEAYVRHYGAAADSNFWFPNTVDGPDFGRRVTTKGEWAKEERARLGIDTRSVALFVGTLNRRKGADLLVQAFTRLKSDHSDAVLVCVGQGDLENELRKTAHPHDVHFVGFVQPEELPKYYAMADMFVLPSLEEPFGAVVCEAAAAGLPIIVSSAVGAVPDFARASESALVVSPGNVGELETAMRRLFSDPALRERMGAAGSALMADWTHERLANTLLQAAKVAKARNGRTPN